MNGKWFDLPVREFFKISLEQKQFFDLDCTVQGFVAGRGAGKTMVGCLKVLYSAKSGDSWAVVSPSEDQIEFSAWPTFVETAERLGVLRRTQCQRTRCAHIAGSDGGEASVYFLSAEKPERMRGPSLAGAWLDDASLMPSIVYTNLFPCLRRMTPQGPRMGKFLLTFTPVPPVIDEDSGEKNPHWTFLVFHDESSDSGIKDGFLYCGKRWRPRQGTGLIKASTKNNPFLPEVFFDTLKEMYPAQLVDSELNGEWLE